MIRIALSIISFVVIAYAIIFICVLLKAIWEKTVDYFEDVKINQDLVVVIICLSLAVIGFFIK